MRIFIIPPALTVSTAALFKQPNRTEGKRNPLQGKPEAEAAGGVRTMPQRMGIDSGRFASATGTMRGLELKA